MQEATLVELSFRYIIFKIKFGLFLIVVRRKEFSLNLLLIRTTKTLIFGCTVSATERIKLQVLSSCPSLSLPSVLPHFSHAIFFSQSRGSRTKRSHFPLQHSTSRSDPSLPFNGSYRLQRIPIKRRQFPSGRSKLIEIWKSRCRKNSFRGNSRIEWSNENGNHF